MRSIPAWLLVALAAACSTSNRTDAESARDAAGPEAPASIAPADRALCQALCDLSASFGCAAVSGRCMDDCLGPFAAGTCLPEKRALVGCQADGGIASLTCVDGATFEREGLCDDELKVLVSCLTAGAAAAGK